MSCREWEEKIARGDPDVERHLERCADCRTFAENMARTLDLLRDAHREPIAEAYFAAVRARVLERVQRKQRAWWPVWAGASALAAAAAPLPGGRGSVRSRGRKRAVRHKSPPSAPPEPLLVKLITDDPNVVIYWIVDPKGD